MLMVVIGWVLFASADVGQAAEIYRAMLCMDVAVITSKDIFLLSNNGLLLVICAVCATDIPKRCMLYLQRNGKGRAYDYLYNVSSLCIMWISVAFLMCDGYNPFLYFRF